MRLHIVGLPVAAVVLSLAPAVATADVVHHKESWRHRITVVHDFNICGDLATFTFDSSGHMITTDTGSGFHLSFQERDTYTVDFDDPALGTWTARSTETGSFHATPGGAETFHFIANEREGPVRIHYRETFVVDANGNVRVDAAQFEVDGC